LLYVGNYRSIALILLITLQPSPPLTIAVAVVVVVVVVVVAFDRLILRVVVAWIGHVVVDSSTQHPWRLEPSATACWNTQSLDKQDRSIDWSVGRSCIVIDPHHSSRQQQQQQQPTTNNQQPTSNNQ
jgi:ABC-type lipoprotein release transport system permease subunit